MWLKDTALRSAVVELAAGRVGEPDPTDGTDRLTALPTPPPPLSPLSPCPRSCLYPHALSFMNVTSILGKCWIHQASVFFPSSLRGKSRGDARRAWKTARK